MKLFLVEDEISLAEMYKLAFEDKGIEIDIAFDGQQALDTLNSSNTHYDAILLDVMIPKINGVKVLETLKSEGSKFKDTPIFMLTNMAENNVIEKAKELGTSGYFIKSNYLPAQFVDIVINKLQEK